MPKTPPMIDLDAARRETAYPDGIPVALGGETFLLPAELPVDALDPLLSDDLDLVGVLKQVFEERKNSDDTDESFGELVLDVLLARPALPRQVIQAIKDVFAALFGAEQYDRFVAQQPSINDYLRLGQALLPLMGVGLGEALNSAGSSEPGGETSNPTSPTTTPDSTPAASGAGRTKRGSSASGG